MKEYTKYFYLAITINDNNNHYSYVLQASENENVYSVLKRIPGIMSANICRTRKEAHEIVDFWNEAYKKNGTYKFDNLI